MIGRHTKMHLWFDNLLSSPIADLLPLGEVISNPELLVSDVLDVNNSWIWDDSFRLAFPYIVKKIEGVIISSQLHDTLF